jgi:hypothetical protein
MRVRNRQYRVAGAWLLSSECAVAAGAIIAAVAVGIRFGIAPAFRPDTGIALAASVIVVAVGIAAYRWLRVLRRRLDSPSLPAG